jgi:integrase
VGRKPIQGADTITLQEAWALTQQAMLNAGKSPATLRGHEISMRCHLAQFADMSLRELNQRRTELIQMHAALRNTPAAANAAIVTLSTIWNQTAKVFPDLGRSPTQAVTQYESRPRKFDVSPGAIRANAEAVRAIINPLRRLAFMALIHCPLRKNELASLQWDDVLPDRLIIREPKGGAKRAYELPLSHQLGTIIADASAFRAEALPWGFWSLGSADGRIVNWNQADVFTPHRFRHAYRSVAHATPGVGFLEAELLLNHRPEGLIGGVASAYIQVPFQRLHDTAQAVSDAMDAITLN